MTNLFLRSFLFCFTLTLAAPLFAVQLAGNDLIIPMSGRTPGAHGSYWHTDLTISNLTPEYKSLTAHIEFFGTRGERASFERAIPAMESITLEDFVRRELALEETVGMVRIRVAQSDARLIARAWVYEAKGIDAGQSIPALPFASLSDAIDLGALSIDPGTRTNIGFANPNDVAARVEYYTYFEHPERRQRVTVPPQSVVQVPLAVGRPDRPIHVDSNVPLYAYASIVRDATADATAVFGTPRRRSAELAITPPCAEPAPLRFAEEATAPGWIFMFHEIPDALAKTNALAAKYGFTPTSIWTHVLGGFAAELTPEMLAALRCEPVVKSVEQNALGWVDDIGVKLE